MFLEGSLEIVEETLSAIEVEDLTRLYEIFIRDVTITPLRFAQIMKFFINLEMNDEFVCDHFNEIDLEALISVWELVGIEEVYETIYSNTSNDKRLHLFHNKTLFNFLRSSDLFSKIWPKNMEMMKIFCDFDGDFSSISFSPTAIYNGSRFFGINRVDYIKNYIKFIQREYIKLEQDFLDYFVQLIAVSRAWISADKRVTEYDGVDFCDKAFRDSECPTAVSIYAALSSTGQAALKHVFAEIYLIRDTIQGGDLVQNIY